MLGHILSTVVDTINDVKLDKHIRNVEVEHREMFTAKAGVEHYKLLGYAARLIDGATILDVGTYKGYSALALADNHTNKIISYDLVKQHKQSVTANIDFRIGDARDYEDFKSVSLILLDTYHDGVYESQFIKHLLDISWHGILLMDDINYPEDRAEFVFFKDLRKLWLDLRFEKYDITHLGHWSGTGIVKL